MAITTYATLQTAIANWINRDDLTDRIPEFIALAEAHFNRRLRRPEMENMATSTASAETLALPTDFLAMRSLYIDASPRRELQYVSHGTLRTQYASTATGEPEVYTIADGGLVFGPAPGTSYTLDMLYWQKITALSGSNTTNWLLDMSPDLYLYGSLVHAAKYIRDDSETAADLIITERMIDELNADGVTRQAGASPLVPRQRRQTFFAASGRGVW